jgi:hypothetical protein
LSILAFIVYAREPIAGINREIVFEDVSNYTDGQEAYCWYETVVAKMEELQQLWAKNATAIDGGANILAWPCQKIHVRVILIDDIYNQV